jgi:hypothetical protein
MSHRPLSFLVLASLLVLAVPAWAAGLADPLLELVPADAGATLAVENLRGHSREILASPLVEAMRRLPEFRRLLETEGFRNVQHASQKLERLLGEDFATLRDKLFGEAVVLSLRLPETGGPESARGLLLVRAPDPPLLDRLVQGLNAAQQGNGELIRIASRQRGETKYHVREFRPGTKPWEYYTVLSSGIFAWSNSEELIHGAIDRAEGKIESLADSPAFRQIRERLPRGAVASLFVEPRFLERLLANSPRSGKAEDERLVALLGRYLSALRYVGAALEWRGGPLLHAEEILDPTATGPAWKRWSSRTASIPGPPSLIPSSALAAASISIDPALLFDGLQALIPLGDQPKLENLLVALHGILLGRDVRSEILPYLAPRMLIHVEPPDVDAPDTRPTGALVLGLDRTPEGTQVGKAIENALRTLLAVHALDERHGDGRLRLESTGAAGAQVSALSSSSPFAFSVTSDRVVIGTSTSAVARTLAAQSLPAAETRLDSLRASHFPGVESFACIDLRALHAFASEHRAALVRRLAVRHGRSETDAARELDQALPLIDLFDAAFVTSTIDPDFARIHRTLGVVGRAGLGQ